MCWAGHFALRVSRLLIAYFAHGIPDALASIWQNKTQVGDYAHALMQSHLVSSLQNDSWASEAARSQIMSSRDTHLQPLLLYIST